MDNDFPKSGENTVRPGLQLQAIGRFGRLPVRQLRYVVDHQVLPGLRGRQDKHQPGQPRSFSQAESFLIACAGALLVAGMKRDVLTQLFARFAQIPWPIPGFRPQLPPPALAPMPARLLDALAGYADQPSTLAVGDGEHVRFIVTEAHIDTGWFFLRTRARLWEDYRPRVVIHLELHALWHELASVNAVK
ncbi:hypothetical protein AYO44_01445 [Planctomycetaceae bacterium SCGC AG-212-F19]|nr:hypothetical protein AYO44_01445 [Planctomycetaceae bacterium SCGC AG-212-F19]